MSKNSKVSKLLMFKRVRESLRAPWDNVRYFLFNEIMDLANDEIDLVADEHIMTRLLDIAATVYSDIDEASACDIIDIITELMIEYRPADMSIEDINTYKYITADFVKQCYRIAVSNGDIVVPNLRISKSSIDKKLFTDTVYKNYEFNAYYENESEPTYTNVTLQELEEATNDAIISLDLYLDDEGLPKIILKKGGKRNAQLKFNH